MIRLHLSWLTASFPGSYVMEICIVVNTFSTYATYYEYGGCSRLIRMPYKIRKAQIQCLQELWPMDTSSTPYYHLLIHNTQWSKMWKKAPFWMYFAVRWYARYTPERYLLGAKYSSSQRRQSRTTSQTVSLTETFVLVFWIHYVCQSCCIGIHIMILQ